MIIRAVIIIPGENFDRIITKEAVKDKDFLPEIEIDNQEDYTIDTTVVAQFEEIVGIKINLVSLEPIEIVDDTILYYAMVASSLDNDLETTATKFKAVHYREAMRHFKYHEDIKIFNEAILWIEQSDYSLEFLSLNLDKMR